MNISSVRKPLKHDVAAHQRSSPIGLSQRGISALLRGIRKKHASSSLHGSAVLEGNETTIAHFGEGTDMILGRGEPLGI